jgi:hypothetical protein
VKIFWIAFSFLMGAYAVSAKTLDFSAPNEDTSLEDTDADSSKAEPLDSETDMTQYELRQSRPWGLGLGIGETVPGAYVTMSALKIFDIQSGFSCTTGGGYRQTTEQLEGDYAFKNKVKRYLVDGSYLWWPSKNFPFVLSGGVSAGLSDGQVSNSIESSSTYKAYSAGVGGGIEMLTYYENGVWVRWTLISGRYFRLLKASYSKMSDSQIKIVRDDQNGFKVVGVGNLTIGYSW